jgi:hypothetical protein
MARLLTMSRLFVASLVPILLSFLNLTGFSCIRSEMYL